MVALNINAFLSGETLFVQTEKLWALYIITSELYMNAPGKKRAESRKGLYFAGITLLLLCGAVVA